MEDRKIIIVSLFYNETDNGRGAMIYQSLKERGVDVRLITADFNHQDKARRVSRDRPDDMVFLPVPKYKRNISFRRIFSHLVFAIRLFSYLRKLNFTPAKVYCQVPTVSSGWVSHIYCHRRKIPLAIDVIDLWPESLIVLYSKKKIVQYLSFPLKWMAEKVYRSADLLFAGSIEYARYVQQFNDKTKATPVYLGADVQKYRSLISSGTIIGIEKPENQRWICFGGSLGKSYDFDIILEGYRKLVNEFGVDNVKLVFIGDGEERSRIERYSKQNGLKIEITGYLPYADYLKYLSFADIAINSFREGTKVAYSYKFNDYVTAGVPVVNNVPGEMADLIEKYKFGRNFQHDAHALSDCLYEMLTNQELLSQMRKNAAFVATRVLDKEIVYKEMVERLIE